MLLAWSIPAQAVTPDPKILAFIPPDTQMLAGINPAPPGNRHVRFLIITRKCALDMEDFRSLSGSDPSRHISQVLFAALSGEGGTAEEHSVLVSGHFDQVQIYRSAIHGGATRGEYRGFKVVEVKPSAGELGVDQVRWLVVSQSSVALFGTVAIVQRELEQQLAPEALDSRLVHLLAALRRDDDAWSIVLRAKNNGIRDALMALNPELARMADGKILRLGIRYGRNIEFEYAIDPALDGNDRPDADSALSPSSSFGPGSSSLFPLLKLGVTRQGGARGTLKVSAKLYDRWLDELSQHENQIRLNGP
jgi:hypothetical protein